MKVILTGTTGFIGTAVLHHCLSHPSITNITTLTRRPLPTSLTNHPSASSKLHQIILEDFLVYPATVIEQLQGATACVWCIGLGMTADRTVNLEYTFAAARKFSSEIPLPQGEKFRFVYTSGAMAVRDQGANLWFMGGVRRQRGEVENGLLDIMKRDPKRWQAVIARPGTVKRRENVTPKGLDGYMKSIRVDELAAALVEAAVEGVGGGVDTLENGELAARGARVLERMKMAGG